MSSKEDQEISYLPCFFELPFKKLWKGKLIEKSWPCVTIWITFGIICTCIFIGGLQHWSAEINWFTTLYFIGGLGWIPALMCGLSHAYYKMYKRMYPFLDGSNKELVEYYEDSAGRTFGYLWKNSINFFISIAIWVFMVITVIIQNESFASEYATASKFIYISYVFVGLIFTCVPCSVLQFLFCLFRLSKYSLKENALYYGAAEQFQHFHNHFTSLIWGIIFLLVLLSIAMLNSPYHATLWIWLPFFGFLPFMLFRGNNRLINSLINSALVREERTLQNQIDEILQAKPIKGNVVVLYALLGIRDKLRIYSNGKSTISNALLLVFTILGGVGSLAAAWLAFVSFNAEFQSTALFLRTLI